MKTWSIILFALILFTGSTNAFALSEWGCTDPGADNYDETAYFDDGSCTYFSAALEYCCRGADTWVQYGDLEEAERSFQSCQTDTFPSIFGATAGSYSHSDYCDLPGD